MSSEKKDKRADDDELDRLARQMLVEEAKRNKIRAETQGALGWKRPTLVTNRKFLRNTLISNAVHNIHRNEREKQQRSQSVTERKQDDYKSQSKRSRTPPSSSRKSPDDDDERASKRTKKSK